MRILAGTAASLVLLVSLTACSTGPNVSDKHFADHAAALNSTSAAYIPGILSVDAKDVDLAVGSEPAGSAMHWSSAGGITASYCEAGPIAGTPTDLGVDWWPASVPSEGFDCGRWMAFESNGEFYAWDAKP